ncbi:MerR family transcriptional regulator [Limosilactobacillus fermentum]|uniref:MerR family transcriptional regulator n=1 Tax=Limosilactobacillus fermentum TaxID=1613 RepID=UPI002F26A05E
MTNTKTKPMTITELSRVTGVSGASITALVKKWKLKPTKTGEYNRKYYSAKDCQRIIDYYSSKAKTGTKTATKTATKDEIIQTLREQIEDQRHQIDQLNEQLKMAQINLNQSQQLQLRQADQIKRLEGPQEATGAVVSASNSQGTEESDEDTRTAHRTNEDDQGEAESPSFFQRLFGKRKKIKF